MKRSWRLNERHYGALQGKDKAQTLAKYGEEQFKLWRRSFDVPPPPIDDNDEFSQALDPRYADLGNEMPKTECLKDVVARMLPYWESEIAHLSNSDIAELNIPTGIPMLYNLDKNLDPIGKGEYLDPKAAAAAIEAVANQGKRWLEVIS